MTIAKVNEFFMLRYAPDGEGIPHFFAEEWQPLSPREYSPDINPRDYPFAGNYQLKVDTDKLDGDYLLTANIVSDAVLSLSKLLDIDFRAIPLIVKLLGGAEPQK